MVAQVYTVAILAVFAQCQLKKKIFCTWNLSRISDVFAATCSRSYTIKAGDYCDKISQTQHVSTFVFALYGRFYPVLIIFLCHCRYQLAAINPSIINKGCSNLTPGESICLGLAGEDCSTTQTVQPGDTCADIAAAIGVNMTILRLNNPQLDESCNIYVGEVRVFFSPCLFISIGGLQYGPKKNPSSILWFLA
jgi:hypothetical protein